MAASCVTVTYSSEKTLLAMEDWGVSCHDMPPAPSGPFRDKLLDAAFFVCLLAIAALATRYMTPLIDDAHITLRRAINLAHGNGLVYNPGERLLGATSPVYAILLAALVPIFSNSVVPAIYLWPVTLALAAWLAYRLVGRGPLGIVAGIVLCTDPGLYPIVGMETTFYVSILLAVLTLFEADRLDAAGPLFCPPSLGRVALGPLG